MPCVDVEVVGGLVEQQRIGSLQQLSGQPERHHFATGQRAKPSFKGDVGQAETVELRTSAVLDIPVVADRREDVLPSLAGVQRLECVERRCDTQHVGNAALHDERQCLRQVADGAVDGHRSRRGSVLAGDQLEEGALPHPVGRDQAGSAVADGERQVGEQRRVVGPGK